MNTINVPIPVPLLKEFYSLPNQAGVHSLINQTCTREIFPKRPTNYILLKSTGPYCFLAGEMNEKDLTDVVQFLNTFPDIKLVCNERHHIRLFLQGIKPTQRIELFYKKALRSFDSRNSLTIKQITTSNLGKKCPWYDFITGLYGAEELFFKNGFGFALCEGDTVLSASYAACIGGNHCEVAIATKPEHTGRGFATIAVKACIQECLKRGLTPEWSCDETNQASLRVALKSGFIINRYYAFLGLK